jgi:exodeoxyribonuclease V beta subunit
VTKTLQLELAPGLRLASVAKRQRLTELEFHLPAAALTAQALRAALPAEAGSTLVFEPRRGLLKGFIDLVFEHSGRFYIVDWKSNWLGPSAASYTADAIEGAMLRHRYALQYHLYTLALHRYLATRQRGYSYAEHFGGVFYLFVRGAEAGVAVHRARPEQALIEELDASFATRP